MSVQDAISLYQNDPRVEYIEPNYYIYADDTFPNDPRFPEMWGLHNTGQTGGTPDADIDAPEGWDFETGEGILVGNIDTGTDWQHQDLADNIYENPNEIPNNGIDDDGNGFIDDVRGWDFVNNDNNPMDDNGHGTHTAGTIGAVGNNGIGVVGVNWRAVIMPVKFLSASGGGTTANAIKSVEYTTMMGMNLTNNSWGGGGFSQALKDAIDDAGAQGILFVAAAGNGASDTDIFPHYPSSYDSDNIISVANTTHNDLLSGLSNWGLTTVDLGAPGSSILSTQPGNSYGLG
ncbi:MAG: S8 family serine peptidase, partial [Candidatus Krumholzibacteria bacterium]|nr:S8 family serine peptidase [Candidatus Krumholzibacteria bacterium]